MKLQQLKNIVHVFLKSNSAVSYVIQIKNGLIKDASVKVIVIAYAEKYIGRVVKLAHVFVRIVSI